MMAAYRQPAATLILRQGPGAGQQFAITEPAITVGRHGSCDIQVDESEVSRQHARITWSGTGYVIEDLGSANGTFVNGERISRPHTLKDGDLLGLGGQVELAFQVAVPPRGEPVEPPGGEPVPPPARVPPPKPAPAKRRNVILTSVAAFLGLCCLLSAIGGLAYFFWPQEEPAPITIVATLTPTSLPQAPTSEDKPTPVAAPTPTPLPQVPAPAAPPPVEATVPPSTPGAVSAPGQPPPSGTILWPIDAAMKTHLRQIMQVGQAEGKRINVFAKVGDSITESMAFLSDYCCGWYDLGPHTELEGVIQYFVAAHADELEAQANPYHTSFDRMSLAAESGAHAGYMLEGGADSNLMQEINAIQPGLAIIMFGTNEALAGEDVATYKANLKQIVTILKEEGVIPIVSTIPDLVSPAEGGERIPAFNQAIKEVALEEQVPLMDFWQALQPLPNKGLDADGVHPNVFMEGDEYRSGYLTPEGLQYGYNMRNKLALEMLAKVKAIVIDDGPPDAGGPAAAAPPTEPPVVSPVEPPVVSPSATLRTGPTEPPATSVPEMAGAVRPFPDTDDGIHVFNDQLAGGSMTEEQFRFAATHYAGCQKMTRTDTRHLRQYNPGFIVLHYRLGLGLGYQEADDACRPNGNWLHFIEGEEWVREWPGDEVVEEGWLFPWAGQPRVYNCDWGWYVMELNDPGWRSWWSDEIIAQMSTNEADGLFADSFNVPNYLGADHYNPPLPGMDAAFEEAWAHRIEDFIAYLQERLGEYYLIPNVGEWVNIREATDYSGVDGVMIEGFSEWEPHSPFELADWQLQMNRILDLTRQDKVIIAQSYLWDPDDVETRLFYLGNYLLVKGRHSYLNIDCSMEPEYFPEYDIELGPPLDELPTEIEGYFNAAWGLYSRRYANGLVLVNPGLNTQSIDLAGTYYLVQPSGGGLVPADRDISAWSVQYRPMNQIELAPNQAAIFLNVTP
jgi:lysophospholipase L1-like esterase